MDIDTEENVQAVGYWIFILIGILIPPLGLAILVGYCIVSNQD